MTSVGFTTIVHTTFLRTNTPSAERRSTPPAWAVLVRKDLKVDWHNAEDPHDITHRRFGQKSKLKQTRICAHVTVSNGAGTSIDIFNTHLSLPNFFSKNIFEDG